MPTISSQRGSRSDSNEGVLSIPQSSKIRASPSDFLMSYPGHSLGKGVLLLCSVFYSPANWAELDLGTVAATDLFPLANQCPRQAIRPLIDQSPGRAH